MQPERGKIKTEREREKKKEKKERRKERKKKRDRKETTVSIAAGIAGLGLEFARLTLAIRKCGRI